MRLPVLFVAGSADGAMPETMPLLAEAVTGSRYQEIADAGHLPCIEQADTFTAVLSAFLS